MSILTILEFPDERLRKKAAVVKSVDDAVRKLADDMLETMYESRGVGLAATQVNVHQRVIVIDVSEDKSAPLYLINPEIIANTDHFLAHLVVITAPTRSTELAVILAFIASSWHYYFSFQFN